MNVRVLIKNTDKANKLGIKKAKLKTIKNPDA